MITKDQFFRIVVIRRMELKLSKTMSDFTGEDQKITLCEATRFLLKNCPDIMIEIDEAIKILKL